MPRIYISPSVQEHNVGVGTYGTEESRMNQIADILQGILVKKGYEVFRNKPTMALKEVVKDSNLNKVDLHLAIHSNATGNGPNSKARGCSVFCHRFQGTGYEFAQNLYSELSKITPVNDRGISKGEDYFGVGKHLYETAYTTAPASLIELAFHDNTDDAKWILDNMQVIAESLAKAVFKTLPIESTFEQDLKLVTDKVNTSYDYWLKKSSKDASVKGLIIKMAKYIKEVEK